MWACFPAKWVSRDGIIHLLEWIASMLTWIKKGAPVPFQGTGTSVNWQLTECQTLYFFLHVILNNNLCGGWRYPYFIKEETEAQRNSVTCPRVTQLIICLQSLSLRGWWRCKEPGATCCLFNYRVLHWVYLGETLTRKLRPRCEAPWCALMLLTL